MTKAFTLETVIIFVVAKVSTKSAMIFGCVTDIFADVTVSICVTVDCIAHLTMVSNAVRCYAAFHAVLMTIMTSLAAPFANSVLTVALSTIAETTA